MYNLVSTLAPSFLIMLIGSSSYLAGEEEEHNISDEFEFRLGSTKECGVSCPWVLEKFPKDLQWGNCSEHSSAFIFDWILFIVAGHAYKLG